MQYSQQDLALSQAVITADTNYTTCACLFPGTTKRYLFRISKKLASTAQIGDTVLVSRNLHTQFSAAVLDEIHATPEPATSILTCYVLSSVSTHELEKSLAARNSRMANMMRTAKDTLKAESVANYEAEASIVAEKLQLAKFCSPTQKS